MTPARASVTARGAALVLAASLLAAGCGGDGDSVEAPPIVASIGPALDALDAGTELYQVAGTPGGVELVVSDGADAVGYTFADGSLSPATPLGPAEGYTFVPADVTFDPDHVLDRVIDELDEPTITRFEVVGGPNGAIYSAQVLSDAGGVLQVDLAANGTVLGAAPLG